MKNITIMVATAMLSFTLGNANAADKEAIASLDASSRTPAFERASAIATGATPKGASSAVAGLRKYRSQVQFERIMRKYHPLGYDVLVDLSEEDRGAIYERYRRGDRMSSVRAAVFAVAANDL